MQAANPKTSWKQPRREKNQERNRAAPYRLLKLYRLILSQGHLRGLTQTSELCLQADITSYLGPGPLLPRKTNYQKIHNLEVGPLKRFFDLERERTKPK
jgi:hypothetical protein